MKIADKELRDLLAGEYVLGTLKGAARRRFEAMLATRVDMQQSVQAWQKDLYPLTTTIEPIEPPARVWQRIRKEITPPSRLRVPTQTIWPWFAIAATLASFIFGGLWWAAMGRASTPVEVAVLGPALKPAWVMSLADKGHVLEVASIRPQALQGHSYQLWMLPGHGAAPRSMGLLPTTAGTKIRVAVPSHVDLAQAAGLAVSIEPPDGSPLPGPSGPVVYEATWVPVESQG